MNGDTKLRQLSGKVVKQGAEILLIFKVAGKYYPATDYNTELFETYLHTGDEKYLSQLEAEMEA